ncbi:RNA polymerase sigma factor [Paenibacillus sp. GXUN7292]|uniref:RNA polymerase sigma factor n=1 Tax=Paenibacillus sp. GXUN7292 TaxID=3422499 RepID=UPI003D7E784A
MHDLHYQYVSQLSPEDMRAIMEQYGDDVWQYAYFLTKKPDMADDIAQEVFIKVYQSIHAFRGESSLKTWLLKITKNTSISLMKRAYFKYHVLTHFIKPAGEHPSAEASVMEKDFTNSVWAQVMKLSSKYREAIVLSAHYEMSTEEIADMLQISVNTVKSRLHRARKELRIRMKGE